MPRHFRFLFTVVALSLLLPSPSWAAGQGTPVFQIGVANGDYHEFAIAGNYGAYAKHFPHDVLFRVGQSNPKQDWPYIQPGPADAWAGSRAHPFRIRFDLPQVVPGYYRLVIDFVDTQAALPPHLTLNLNGTVVTRPFPAGNGDASLTNPGAGRHGTLEQLFPARLFHAGTNTLTLLNAQGSWLLYDDVRLESGAPAPAQPLRLEVTMVPYLLEHSATGERRVARVTMMNLAGRPEAGELRWTLTGAAKSWTGAESVQLHFGRHGRLLQVPALAQPGSLKLTLRVGGRELHATTPVKPTRKWRVYIVPTAHTDIGYTDLQKNVMARHAENGIRALNLSNQYADFTWNFETYWQFDCFLRAHPDQAANAFRRLRQGRFGLAALFANMLTGLCSHEALNRVTLSAWELAREHHFPLRSAILDDVPSAVGSLPMVLADSGIHYFIEGANTTRAPYATQGVPVPFYWEGPDGSRVLSCIVPGYGHAGSLISSLAQARARLPGYLARFDRADYPYDAVLVNGAFSDNGAIQDWLPKVVQEWNARWAYPRLILAKPEDFFRHIESKWAQQIPVRKTDFGTWWEDGAASSARATALDRRAENRAVTAEMLHSLTAVLGGTQYPKAAFDNLWRNILLYDEHTWGAWCSVSQPNAEQTIKEWDVKRSYARKADKASRHLVTTGLAQLSALTPKADLLVFNPLAWSRSSLVRTATATAVQDVASSRTFPCQALPEGGSCFIAPELPSVGYRTYRRLPSKDAFAQPLPLAVRFSPHQMENQYYRVRFDPGTGALISLLDKQTGRELVDARSPYGLGEVIYASGPEGHVVVHRQKLVRSEHHNGPVFGEWVSEAKNDHLPDITLRVRLYRGLKRITFRYELDKVATTNKEAVYIAFPLALNLAGGGLWLEYPDTITRPLRDLDPSGCRSWFAVQRWLAASDGHTTVVLTPLDTPLVTLGGLTGSEWPHDLHLPRADVFAYVMNNYWFTNYKASQNGRFVFRFALTSTPGGFSRGEALQRGWDLYAPPVAQRGGNSTDPILPAAASLLRVAPNGLPLLAFKHAEDGGGYILRLGNLAGDRGQATLTLPKPARATYKCNLVEGHAVKMDSLGKTITAPLKPFGLTTVKVQFR